MRSILNIAKAELKHLFFSPMAWLGSVILVLLCADLYITALTSYIAKVDLGNWYNGLTHVLTTSCPFTAWMKKMLVVITKFVLPFILMGSISRELSAGTMRLIDSSPVGTARFVWGKFLGLAGFCAILVGIFALMVVVFGFSIKAPEVSLLAGQLGVTLLYYVFIASICLFASSLSSYAIVGGVVSMLMLMLLNMLGSVGQSTVLGDFFFPLSHQGIVMRMIGGGVDWNDVIVLLVFTVLFVQLTVVHLQNRSRAFSTVRRTLRFSLCVLVAGVSIGLLPYTPIGYSDFRRANAATLNPDMQHILTEMNGGPLEVTHYFNIIFPPDLRAQYYVPGGRPRVKYEAWRGYMYYKQDIHVNYKYYFAADTADYGVRMVMRSYPGKSEAEVARILANTYGYDMDEVMTLDEVQRELDVTAHQRIGHLIRLGYQGRETVVVSPGYTLPRSINFYPAFERLVSGEDNRLLFVRDGKPRESFYKTSDAFLTTDKETAMTEENWVQTGPVLDSIRLEKEEIPAGTQSLVLLGPRQQLPHQALSRIEQFIDQGGNLLLAGEPAYREAVKPLMDYLGVGMKREAVVQPTEKFGSGMVLGQVDPQGLTWLPLLDSARSVKRLKGLVSDTLAMVFDQVAGLDASAVKDFAVTPLVYSPAGLSWNRTALQDFDSLQLLLEKQPGDEEGRFPLLLLLHREIKGKQQRILISGDADILRDYRDSKIPGNERLSVHQDVLSVLTGGKFPVNLEPPRLPDNGFRITMAGVHTQQALLGYGLPALIALAGAFVLIKRRRK